MEYNSHAEDWVDISIQKKEGEETCRKVLKASSGRAALHAIGSLILTLAHETDGTVMQVISCILEDMTGGMEDGNPDR